MSDQDRLLESLKEMQQASDLIDESYGGSDYNARLIALALIAREFLRRNPDAALRACAEARPSTEQAEETNDDLSRVPDGDSPQTSSPPRSPQPAKSDHC